MTLVNEDILAAVNGTGIDVSKTANDLLDNIWREIASDRKANSLIAGITQMTRRALNASVSLLFFIDEETQELVLKYSGGLIMRQVRRFPIDEQSGLTGWVARSGRLRCAGLGEGWRMVREAQELPLPDTSWMRSPWTREKFMGWTGKR